MHVSLMLTTRKCHYKFLAVYPSCHFFQWQYCWQGALFLGTRAIHKCSCPVIIWHIDFHTDEYVAKAVILELEDCALIRVRVLRSFFASLNSKLSSWAF